MNSWDKKVIGKAINFNPSESLKRGTIAPKIPMGNLTEHQRKIGGYELAKYKSGPKFRNGDTLLAKITPCLENGKTAQVDILEEGQLAFGSSEFIVLRATEHTTPDFVYYLSISPTFRKKAISCMEGTSGRKRVRHTTLKKFELPFPRIEEQKRITGILKAIDSKIELNNKINKELESMAKLIYDYWFVQFDFPNENGMPYKSSGGEMVHNEKLGREIPRSWNEGTIMDCADLIGGGTPSKKNRKYWNGDIPFFTPSDTEDNIYCFKTELNTNTLGISKSSTKLFKKGTVFITARGSVGKINMAGTEMAMNQSCYALRPKDNYSSEFVYFHTGLMVDLLKVKSSGSTFNSIVTNDFDFTPVVIPDRKIINEFGELAEPVFSKIWLNKKENEELAQLRDWLLPMLMNGQVTVKEAEEGLSIAAEPEEEYG